jgi:tRNA N6-adenosine threonylcarbamoyltransferase
VPIFIADCAILILVLVDFVKFPATLVHEFAEVNAMAADTANSNLSESLLVLGLETTCDETAAALVQRRADGSGDILANIVHSQIAEHTPYGGVVPELAARAHVEILDTIIRKALDEAGHDFAELDGVAVAAGPGLIGGVIVGLMTAKAIALVHNTPLIAVNHLEAHALTPRLTDDLEFPYLLLLVSGGHTQLLQVAGVGKYERLGTTIDDALGEAFDKTAKLLGLGFPGGPAVEQAARAGDPARFTFPRPMIGRDELHFSFSGLKTAVRYAAQEIEPLGEQDIADLCASFQDAVADILIDRLGRMLDRHGTTPPLPLVVAGGVAANQYLRVTIEKLATDRGTRLVIPPPALCTDNGAMIAWAGAERLALGMTDPLNTGPRARWPLDPDAVRAPGAGVKA